MTQPGGGNDTGGNGVGIDVIKPDHFGEAWEELKKGIEAETGELTEDTKALLDEAKALYEQGIASGKERAGELAERAKQVKEKLLALKGEVTQDVQSKVDTLLDSLVVSLQERLDVNVFAAEAAAEAKNNPPEKEGFLDKAAGMFDKQFNNLKRVWNESELGGKIMVIGVGLLAGATLWKVLKETLKFIRHPIERTHDLIDSVGDKFDFMREHLLGTVLGVLGLGGAGVGIWKAIENGHIDLATLKSLADQKDFPGAAMHILQGISTMGGEAGAAAYLSVRGWCEKQLGKEKTEEAAKALGLKVPGGGDGKEGPDEKKKEDDEQAKESNETSPKMVPLSEAVGTWKVHLRRKLRPIVRLANENKSLARTLGGAMAVNNLGTICGGGALTANMLIGLGKIPFAAASGFPISSFCIVMAALYKKEEIAGEYKDLANIQVPEDPEELKKYLAQQVKQQEPWLRSQGLRVADFAEEAHVEVVADLIKRPETLDQYLGKAEEMLEGMVGGALDLLSATKESYVQRQNVKGFEAFISHMQGFNDDPENFPNEEGIYTDFIKDLESFRSDIILQKKIPPEVLEELQEKAENHGIIIEQREGIYQWCQVDEDGFVRPGRAWRNLCIDPSLKDVDQSYNLAEDFRTEDGFTTALGKGWEVASTQARVSWGNSIDQMRGENGEINAFSIENILKAGGYFVFVEGGAYVCRGAGEKYFFGPARLLRDALNGFYSVATGKEEEYSYTQVFIDYSKGILPVTVLGTPSILSEIVVERKFPWRSLGRTAIYPYSGLTQGIDILRHDVVGSWGEAKRLGQPGLRGIFSNPRARLKTGFWKIISEWQSYRATRKGNKAIASQKATLAKLYGTLYYLHKAKRAKNTKVLLNKKRTEGFIREAEGIVARSSQDIKDVVFGKYAGNIYENLDSTADDNGSIIQDLERIAETREAAIVETRKLLEQQKKLQEAFDYVQAGKPKKARKILQKMEGLPEEIQRVDDLEQAKEVLRRNLTDVSDRIKAMDKGPIVDDVPSLNVPETPIDDISRTTPGHDDAKESLDRLNQNEGVAGSGVVDERQPTNRVFGGADLDEIELENLEPSGRSSASIFPEATEMHFEAEGEEITVKGSDLTGTQLVDEPTDVASRVRPAVTDHEKSVTSGSANEMRIVGNDELDARGILPDDVPEGTLRSPVEADAPGIFDNPAHEFRKADPEVVHEMRLLAEERGDLLAQQQLAAQKYIESKKPALDITPFDTTEEGRRFGREMKKIDRDYTRLKKKLYVMPEGADELQSELDRVRRLRREKGFHHNKFFRSEAAKKAESARAIGEMDRYIQELEAKLATAKASSKGNHVEPHRSVEIDVEPPKQAIEKLPETGIKPQDVGKEKPPKFKQEKGKKKVRGAENKKMAAQAQAQRAQVEGLESPDIAEPASAGRAADAIPAPEKISIADDMIEASVLRAQEALAEVSDKLDPKLLEDDGVRAVFEFLSTDNPEELTKVADLFANTKELANLKPEQASRLLGDIDFVNWLGDLEEGIPEDILREIKPRNLDGLRKAVQLSAEMGGEIDVKIFAEVVRSGGRADPKILGEVVKQGFEAGQDVAKVVKNIESLAPFWTKTGRLTLKALRGVPLLAEIGGVVFSAIEVNHARTQAAETMAKLDASMEKAGFDKSQGERKGEIIWTHKESGAQLRVANLEEYFGNIEMKSWGQLALDGTSMAIEGVIIGKAIAGASSALATGGISLIVAGVAILGTVAIEGWKQTDKRELLDHMPLEVLVALGGTGSAVGASEHEVAASASSGLVSDLWYNDAEQEQQKQEIREKAMMVLAYQQLEHLKMSDPQLYADITRGYKNTRDFLETELYFEADRQAESSEAEPHENREFFFDTLYTMLFELAEDGDVQFGGEFGEGKIDTGWFDDENITPEDFSLAIGKSLQIVAAHKREQNYPLMVAEKEQKIAELEAQLVATQKTIDEMLAEIKKNPLQYAFVGKVSSEQVSSVEQQIPDIDRAEELLRERQSLVLEIEQTKAEIEAEGRRSILGVSLKHISPREDGKTHTQAYAEQVNKGLEYNYHSRDSLLRDNPDMFRIQLDRQFTPQGSSGKVDLLWFADMATKPVPTEVDDYGDEVPKEVQQANESYQDFPEEGVDQARNIEAYVLYKVAKEVAGYRGPVNLETLKRTVFIEQNKNLYGFYWRVAESQWVMNEDWGSDDEIGDGMDVIGSITDWLEKNKDQAFTESFVQVLPPLGEDDKPLRAETSPDVLARKVIGALKEGKSIWEANRAFTPEELTKYDTKETFHFQAVSEKIRNFTGQFSLAMGFKLEQAKEESIKISLHSHGEDLSIVGEEGMSGHYLWKIEGGPRGWYNLYQVVALADVASRYKHLRKNIPAQLKSISVEDEKIGFVCQNPDTRGEKQRARSANPHKKYIETVFDMNSKQAEACQQLDISSDMLVDFLYKVEKKS